MTEVAWVTGRKKALARATAIFICETQNKHWFRITQAERDALTKRCERQITEWTNNEVLAEFQHEWSEK